jgi:CHAT domain-containing protein
LFTAVLEGSNAHRHGLKEGDVLLKYGQDDVNSLADLMKLIEAHQKDKDIEVTVWREDREKPLTLTVQPGRFGAVFAREPAPQALAPRREGDGLLAKRRSGSLKLDSLPKTRVEAEALGKLFDAADAGILLDSDASEQKLYEKSRNNELGKYRYIHLATHGLANSERPLQSAIELAKDQLPDPDKQLIAGIPVFDGRLTAEDVLRQWRLQADLVTLSACQTALGKHEGGEGFVGFAQALTLAGSRSICLSLWKVNDTATALLMKRFYENLLGKRKGLSEPLKKAAALQEAKAWLRELPSKDALKLTADLTKGVARGPRPTIGKPNDEKPRDVAPGDHPYAHPYYWAAFVLFGEGV